MVEVGDRSHEVVQRHVGRRYVLHVPDADRIEGNVEAPGHSECHERLCGDNWPMNIVVLNHVSLEGVMQGPGRADEDTRGGFIHGGWAVAGGDQVMAEWIGPIGTGAGGAMLFGRRSYEGMLSSWNRQGGPFKDA